MNFKKYVFHQNLVNITTKLSVSALDITLNNQVLMGKCIIGVSLIEMYYNGDILGV